MKDGTYVNPKIKKIVVISKKIDLKQDKLQSIISEYEKIKKSRDLHMVSAIQGCLKKYPDRKVFVILGRDHVLVDEVSSKNTINKSLFNILDLLPNIKSASILFKESKESIEIKEEYEKWALFTSSVKESSDEFSISLAPETYSSEQPLIEDSSEEVNEA